MPESVYHRCGMNGFQTADEHKHYNRVCVYVCLCNVAAGLQVATISPSLMYIKVCITFLRFLWFFAFTLEIKPSGNGIPVLS